MFGVAADAITKRFIADSLRCVRKGLYDAKGVFL